MKPGQLLWAVLATLLLNGCASVPNGETRYVLCDPSAAMVHYNVSKEDKIGVTLSDGSVQQLTVDTVDEFAITGMDGVQVPIDTIHELRCSDSEAPVFVQVMYAALYPVLGTASIVLLPIAIPAVLLYDEDAVDNWPDDRLCEVSWHPLQYGYLESGQHGTDENMPAVPEIEQELERRGLACDMHKSAEEKCARMYYSGFQFSECVEIVTSMERVGFSAVGDWSDAALCEVDQNPRFFYLVSRNLPGGQDTMKRVASSAKEYVELKGLECPVPLGSMASPYAVRDTHTACPAPQDLGR